MKCMSGSKLAAIKTCTILCLKVDALELVGKAWTRVQGEAGPNVHTVPVHGFAIVVCMVSNFHADDILMHGMRW